MHAMELSKVTENNRHAKKVLVDDLVVTGGKKAPDKYHSPNYVPLTSIQSVKIVVEILAICPTEHK